MRPMRFPLVVGIGLVSTLVHATSLQVLYDSGDTLPLGPVLDASGFREETQDPLPPPPSSSFGIVPLQRIGTPESWLAMRHLPFA